MTGSVGRIPTVVLNVADKIEVLGHFSNGYIANSHAAVAITRKLCNSLNDAVAIENYRLAVNGRSNCWF